MGQNGSVLQTPQYERASKACKDEVDRIVAKCQADGLDNFRDPAFDVVKYRDNCLQGLIPGVNHIARAGNALRVKDIFDDPTFVVTGGTPHKVVQSEHLYDCWFIAALATIASGPESEFKLWIDRICVRKDESKGVYGFLFFRDAKWVPVIIDDRLFVNKMDPKKKDEKAELYFSKSGDANETWVPLIEKAYAKLHGDYSALHMGTTGDAMVDLTGGAVFRTSLLDYSEGALDNFWAKLLKGSPGSGRDRFFGCDSPIPGRETRGLKPNHAYSVLCAKEHDGRRYVVLRDPYGKGGWVGEEKKELKVEETKEVKPGEPKQETKSTLGGAVLGDAGSKTDKGKTAEDNQERDATLTALGYTPGASSGEFFMEYKDFAKYWRQVEETRLSNNWDMKSLFLQLNLTNLPGKWKLQKAPFTFSLEEKAKLVVVLAQLGTRHFRGLEPESAPTFSFNIYSEAEGRKVTSPGNNRTAAAESLGNSANRSVSVEVELEAGTYAIQTDIQVDTDPKMKLLQILDNQAKSRSIALNYDEEVMSRARDRIDSVYFGVRIYGPKDIGLEIQPVFPPTTRA